MYGPYLTVTELKTKYPNQWVLLGNPTKSRHDVTGGYVLCSAADPSGLYEFMIEWDDPAVKHTASWYTGEWQPEGVFPPDAAPESGAA